MKICNRCGNEIDQMESRCCFCGCRQRCRAAVTGGHIPSFNIKNGLPAVEEGLSRLDKELMSARRAGVALIRIIHGWGSGGSGGKLRDACRKSLTHKKDTRQIKSFLAGEQYSRKTVAGKKLMRRYPGLLPDERTDSNNPGITLVEL